MKNIIIIFLFVIVLSSCDEVVELDIQQVEFRFIIEALVINQLGWQYVQFIWIIFFGVKEKVFIVSGVLVSVLDVYGYVMDYIESMFGYYVFVEFFVGIFGMIYIFYVEVDG